VLFGTAELLQWMKQFSLPLPIFILGGAFLAVASNYDKLTHLPFHPDHEESAPLPPTVSPTVSPAVKPKVVPPSPPSQSGRPISFIIRKPYQAED